MSTPPTSPSHHPSLKQAVATIKLAGKLSGITLPSTSPPPLHSIATIAIMSMPMIEVKYDGFNLPDSLCAAAGGINSFYVRWLEAAGVRCYILQWDDPWEKKLQLLQHVKGVLLPGGDLDHFQDVLEAYFAEVKKVYDYALDQHRNHGNPFFMWGTCQGFQLLCACGANSLDVIRPGFEGVLCKMLPLEFTGLPTEEKDPSRFLCEQSTPTEVMRSLRGAPSTLNVHRYGVLPGDFSADSSLGRAFRVVSTNVDAKGRRFVSSMERVACLQSLCDAGVDLTVKDKNGWTAAHYAAMDGHVACLQVLRAADVNLTAKDVIGRTVAHYAAMNGHAHCLQSLCDAGVDLTAKDDDGRTAAHYAAGNGHVACLQVLRDAGVDLAVKDRYGWTLPHHAVRSDLIPSLQWLRDAGVDLTVQDNNGETPAYHAAQHGRFECLQLLRDADVDLTAKSNDGSTAAHIAAIIGFDACLRLLHDAGVAGTSFPC